MNDHLHLDGSQGEGGGQIVRSSLALSLVTGRSFTIENLRGRRDRPGLARQHLTAVRAAAQVGGADVEGDEVGSRSFTFRPTGLNAGDYTFDIGTAGSTTLVLQTVLPALMIADGPSRILLKGGTHNHCAPSYEFLAKAYVPLVNRMGVRVNAEVERYGFYPVGGGRFTVDIEPTTSLSGFDLLDRGADGPRRATALLSRLPEHIGQRELDYIAGQTDWPSDAFHLEVLSNTFGPGNALILEVHSQHVSEVFTGIGRLVVRAEAVAEEAYSEMREYLDAGVPVGCHLADQLMLPLGIAAWQTGTAAASARCPSRSTRPRTWTSCEHFSIATSRAIATTAARSSRLPEPKHPRVDRSQGEHDAYRHHPHRVNRKPLFLRLFFVGLLGLILLFALLFLVLSLLLFAIHQCRLLPASVRIPRDCAPR